MTDTPSRRDVLKTAGAGAAASVLAGVSIPFVHAAEDNTIRVALIGAGGRGNGAAENALSVTVAPTKLVAVADVFPDNAGDSTSRLLKKFPTKVDVPVERRFVSFDGYKKAIDCLRPGDVAIFATPPGFRWVHFEYAIQKGVNVFMEKPVTVDGPSTKKLLKLAEESEKKNLKVGVGLMCRHCDARRELHDRIKNGEMGDLLLLRAYRQAGRTAKEAAPPNKDKMNELLYQIKWFHSFLWASGGSYSDFLIHNIDECCWMKDAWPVRAEGSGGRHYRGDAMDQNFDNYSIEYTFADGTKLRLEGRTMPGCKSEFASYAHGTKGSAIVSQNGHWPSGAKIFKGHNIPLRGQPGGVKPSEVAWSYGRETNNPYQAEWDRLIEAIVKGKPHNEARRGAEASLVTSMGRWAAHTGQVITYDQMLNSEHEFAPEIDKLSFEAPAPVQLGKNGKYPIPEPGPRKGDKYREYYS